LLRLASTLAVAATLAAAAPAHAGEPDGDTLGTQVKGAGFGLLVGGGIGLLAGLGFGGRDKAVSAGLGASIGIMFGVPIGIQQTADAAGGTGKSWGTALGTVIGMSAAGASIYGSRNAKATPDVLIPEFLIVVGCVIAGPVIGYRATEDRHTVMPVLLSGSF
jgi:hypothetical protein